MTLENAVRTTHGVCAMDSFARIVARHGGDSGVRNLSCTEQFRAMAFAQLTYRESLGYRSLFAGQPDEAVQLGFRAPVKRSTLADANEARNWHIWEELAMLLIRRARNVSRQLRCRSDQSVYA